jgi:hypothetical protein
MEAVALACISLQEKCTSLTLRDRTSTLNSLYAEALTSEPEETLFINESNTDCAELMSPEFSAEPIWLSNLLNELESEELLLDVERVLVVELALLLLPSRVSRSLYADLALDKSPDLMELNRFSMSAPSSFSVEALVESKEDVALDSDVSLSKVTNADCAEEISLFDSADLTLVMNVPTGSVLDVLAAESFSTSARYLLALEVSPLLMAFIRLFMADSNVSPLVALLVEDVEETEDVDELVASFENSVEFEYDDMIMFLSPVFVKSYEPVAMWCLRPWMLVWTGTYEEV